MASGICTPAALLVAGLLAVGHDLGCQTKVLLSLDDSEGMAQTLVLNDGPLLRQKGSGHILGVSSSLGIVPMPLIGFYAATKAAVESLHETMAQEIRPFGIKVTLIEPGAYATDFGKSAKRADGMEAYEELRKQVMAKLATSKRGDPQATPEAILKRVDSENPPLRLALGSTLLPAARAAYADRIATWEAWEEVSNAAQGGS